MASSESNQADPAAESTPGDEHEFHNPVLTRDPFRKHDRQTGLLIGIAIAAVTIAVAGAAFFAIQGGGRQVQAAPETAASAPEAPA